MILIDNSYSFCWQISVPGKKIIRLEHPAHLRRRCFPFKSRRIIETRSSILLSGGSLSHNKEITFLDRIEIELPHYYHLRLDVQLRIKLIIRSQSDLSLSISLYLSVSASVHFIPSDDRMPKHQSVYSRAFGCRPSSFQLLTESRNIGFGSSLFETSLVALAKRLYLLPVLDGEELFGRTSSTIWPFGDRSDREGVNSASGRLPPPSSSALATRSYRRTKPPRQPPANNDVTSRHRR